jgi:hypothetical protein
MVDFIENLVSLLNERIIAPPPACGGGRSRECGTAMDLMLPPLEMGGGAGSVAQQWI